MSWFEGGSSWGKVLWHVNRGAVGLGASSTQSVASVAVIEKDGEVADVLVELA